MCNAAQITALHRVLEYGPVLPECHIIDSCQQPHYFEQRPVMSSKFSLMNLIDSWLNRRKLRATLRALETVGLSLSTVYDIGANKGRWSKSMQQLLPYSKFILFEANETHRGKLASRNFPFFICVLGAKEEKRRFYSIGGTGDSLYLEKTDHYQESNFREVTTRTLSSLAQENKLPAPNFIKLDVQGAELDILEGGKEILQHCHLIYMECPVMEYNEGAPHFDAYIQFMSDLSFFPLHILEQHLVNGALVQVDILFIRKSAAERLNRIH